MKFVGLSYFLLGFLFVYLTFLQVEANGGWGVFAFILAFIASVDFYLGWRSIRGKQKDNK
ncbi:DUF4305 domain-containing protein [Shouchella patagoniensis]|uniref:DUF4305 domain-containing protein n=1 Tax=Shouchella patagoniensis TaxID=228576 RepID=UPI0009950F13|nr:DUF4305 domain-containing protein [Shouchella patagoniensis]